jgi:hypothetical protein
MMPVAPERCKNYGGGPVLRQVDPWLQQAWVADFGTSSGSTGDPAKRHLLGFSHQL